MVETIDGLERAIVVLKRGQTSFLQQRDRNELKELTAVFSKMIEANWVNKKDKAVVQSLLQSTETDGDEDLSLQPQAKTSSYEGHGCEDLLQLLNSSHKSTSQTEVRYVDGNVLLAW